MDVCIIEGCGRPVHIKLRGLCNTHYLRWRRHGDPLGGGTYRGATQSFILDVIKSEVINDCIIWPFARDKHGYGWVRRGDKSVHAHSVICELKHGPKQNKDFEVLHTCGNGKSGCVNPNHLRWGTRRDNVADALRHGTAFGMTHPGSGELNLNSKFSDAEIAEARSLIGKMPQKEIAAKFGMSRSYLSRIKLRKSRAHGSVSPTFGPRPRDATRISGNILA